MIATLKELAPVLSAALAGVVALIALIRAPGRNRAHLKADADILNALPEGHPARQRLSEHIAKRVDQIVTAETELSRDWPAFAMSVVIAPVLAYVIALLVRSASIISVLVALPLAALLLVFIYGIFESGGRARRDAKGFRTDG